MQTIFPLIHDMAVTRILSVLAQSSDAGAALALGGVSIFTLFLIVGPIILWIWMLVWVNKDAAKHGQSGCMPMMLVFFLGPIGLIIYLLMRPKEA